MELGRRRLRLESEAPAVRGARDRCDTRTGRLPSPTRSLHCHSNFSFLDGASHPKSLPPRRAASGWRRWRSPITTASTAWSASPRLPRRWACRRCSAVRSRSIADDGRASACARSEADTSPRSTPARARFACPRPGRDPSARACRWVRRIRPLSRRMSHGSSGGREGGPQFAFGDLADAVWPVTPGCSPVAARERSRPRW